VHIHPQNHPHFAYADSLHQIYAACFIYLFFLRGGGAVVYYIVQCINSYARVSRLMVFWLQRMRISRNSECCLEDTEQ
jgi:hypothetical protein